MPIFPGCSHVTLVGLAGNSDSAIWDFCIEKDFTIISKDTDIRERSFLNGYPPKIIWLDVGNSETSEIVSLITRNQKRINRFINLIKNTTSKG